MFAGPAIYETFRAYLFGVVISRVLATWDFAGSKTNMIPDQSGLRSVDLQLGHTLPVVITLHLLHAFSLANYFLSPPFFSFRATVCPLCLSFSPAPLDFLISSAIHSTAPRNGCLHVMPILPMPAPLPRLTAVILARSFDPILSDLAVWFATITP